MLSRWCIFFSISLAMNVCLLGKTNPTPRTAVSTSKSKLHQVTPVISYSVKDCGSCRRLRERASSERKQLCDWKHVEDQRCAPRTGSIVKKSWLELNCTDRPHQRNMAVRVTLNQTAGQTEKCQDWPASVLSILIQPSTHSLEWKTLKDPFSNPFLLIHSKKTGGTVQEVEQHLLFNEPLELVKVLKWKEPEYQKLLHVWHKWGKCKT